jgi:hypothetical protein
MQVWLNNQQVLAAVTAWLKAQGMEAQSMTYLKGGFFADSTDVTGVAVTIAEKQTAPTTTNESEAQDGR